MSMKIYPPLAKNLVPKMGLNHIPNYTWFMGSFGLDKGLFFMGYNVLHLVTECPKSCLTWIRRTSEDSWSWDNIFIKDYQVVDVAIQVKYPSEGS